MPSCHRQNAKENSPHTHKRQIDISRGKLSMDAPPNMTNIEIHVSDILIESKSVLTYFSI